MIALLHALTEHQSVSVGVLSAAGTAAKPWFRSFCKHSKDGQPSPFKRTGRNAKKQKRRFFVFPELAADEHASTTRKPLPTTAIVTSLLQDLRLPSVALPVRYFLEAEKKRPGDVSTESGPLFMGSKDPEWVIAVPDTRMLHGRSAGTAPNSLESMRSHAAKAESLRSLVSLMEFGKDGLRQDPSFVATAFANIDRQLRASEAAQYARYPASLSAVLPHVSAAVQWQGNLQQDAEAARSAQLLPETAVRVAQQYLLPVLETSTTLMQLNTAQLADIAAALAVLQKKSSYTLAPSFWQHVRTLAESEEESLRRIVNMGDSSRISSVVQQSSAVLPEDARTAASLLHASRTWLQPAQARTVAAVIPTLSPEQTVWCFLAMHTRRSELNAEAHSPEPELEPTQLTSMPIPVWEWIESNRTAVARKKYSINKKYVQALLRQRLQEFTPTRASFSERATAANSDPEEEISSAMHLHRVDSHSATSEKLRWPEHAPLLFAGLSMPITNSLKRQALRPLFSASAACVMSDRVLCGGSIEAGHWIGLLDLTSCSLAAMSSTQHQSASALVTKACEELQAQLDVLRSHHVASSVSLLGEILTKQASVGCLECTLSIFGAASSRGTCRGRALDHLPRTPLYVCVFLIIKLHKYLDIDADSFNHLNRDMGPAEAMLQDITNLMQGFGRPLPASHLHAFTRRIANRSLDLISEPSLENAEAMRSMLSMLGDVQLRYQQVVPFLRRCTAILHAHLKATDGADHSNKALAHILLGLGQLRIPFDTVYPLVLSVCEILHDRTPSMDVTEVYLIVDALAKLKAPTPEVAPLLLSMMAHLSQGLDIRPTKPALHMNILTTPTSQLLKLAHSIKTFMPQTHGLLTMDMQAAPKAAFMRSLISHIMRLRLADLNHRDLLHLLQLVKDSRLGRDLPKPWTQDSALRVLDRLHAHLFDGTTKQVPETMYWQDQPLYDLMYTGIGASPPVQLQAASISVSGNHSYSQTSSTGVALHSGARRLVSDDVFPQDHDTPSLEANGPPYGTALPSNERFGDPTWGSDPWRPSSSVPQQHSKLDPSEYAEPTERWAYRKVYSIVRDSQTVILGSLRALDWDAQITHAVKTISENIGPRGMNASFSTLDNTLQASSVTHQRWRQIEYSGQDYSPEELLNYESGRLREKWRRGGSRGGRGRGRGRGRAGRGGYRQRMTTKPDEFIVPTVPDIEALDLSKTSTLLQTHCRFRPVDCARLLVAIAELYSDSASAGRELMHGLGPKLFSQFPPSNHNVPDLARMIWALGVLSGPRCGLEHALPALHTAITRCKENMTMMDPKFTMLAAKGLALMARGGMVMHAAYANGKPLPMLWPALTQAPQDNEALSDGVETLSTGAHQSVEQAQELAHAARSYMMQALEHFSRSPSQGSPVALKLRPEGLAEAVAAGMVLGDPKHLDVLRDVWRIAIDSLETHDLPQDVPLRAPSALIITAVHLLHATRDQNSKGVKGQSEWGFQQSQSQEHQKMMREVCDRVPVVTQVARERLLHNRRRPTVLQVRAFSAALLKLAEEGVPMEDAGLVQALVAMSVDAPALWNAKQRGIGGARRLVQHLEDLAALERHGVLFQGAEEGISSGSRAYGSNLLRINVDASLLQSMQTLRTEVEAAVLRDSTTPAEHSMHASDSQMDERIDVENVTDSGTGSMPSGIEGALEDLPSPTPIEPVETGEDANEDTGTHEGVAAVNSTVDRSEAPLDPDDPFAHGYEFADIGDSSELDQEHEGEYILEDEPDKAEEDDRLIVEKLDESLQAVVNRTEWRQGAWSPELAQRLFAALNTLSARNDSEGS